MFLLQALRMGAYWEFFSCFFYPYAHVPGLIVCINYGSMTSGTESTPFSIESTALSIESGMAVTQL